MILHEGLGRRGNIIKRDQYVITLTAFSSNQFSHHRSFTFILKQTHARTHTHTRIVKRPATLNLKSILYCLSNIPLDFIFSKIKVHNLFHTFKFVAT